MSEQGETATGWAARRREPVTFVCRCEEVASEEIVAALVAGASSVDDVKRRTRAGMGVCQGIFCQPVIAAMLGQARGTSLEQVAPMTARPPVRVIPLEVLAQMAQSDSDPD